MQNLPIDTSLPWYPEEESFRGISAERARNILNDFEMHDMLPNAKGQIWILCSAKDKSKTILLNRSFDGGKYMMTGLCKFKGVIQCKDLDLTDLVKEHNLLQPNFHKIENVIQ